MGLAVSSSENLMETFVKQDKKRKRSIKNSKKDRAIFMKQRKKKRHER